MPVMDSEAKKVYSQWGSKKRGAVNRLLDVVGKHNASAVVKKCNELSIEEIVQTRKTLEANSKELAEALAQREGNYTYWPVEKGWRMGFKLSWRTGVQLGSHRWGWWTKARYCHCRSTKDRRVEWKHWQVTTDRRPKWIRQKEQS